MVKKQKRSFCKLLIRGVLYISLERRIVSDYKPRFQHCFDFIVSF